METTTTEFEAFKELVGTGPWITGNRAISWGWVQIKDLQDPVFERIAQTVEVGGISDPFRSELGFHIIKLHGKRDIRRPDLQNDWNFIENLARNRKQYEEFNEWIDEIKSSFYIDVRI